MGNSKILKELKIYSECNNFVENPCDASRKIYIFPDVPHCIKNLRNHCLDYGLCLKVSDDKTLYLTKKHFENLISGMKRRFYFLYFREKNSQGFLTYRKKLTLYEVLKG
jgi:hypothetical protein